MPSTSRLRVPWDRKEPLSLPRIRRLSGVPETSLPRTWHRQAPTGPWGPPGTKQGAAHSPPSLTYGHGHQAARPGRLRAHHVLVQPWVEVEPAGRGAASAGQCLRPPASLPASRVPTWCCSPPRHPPVPLVLPIAMLSSRCPPSPEPPCPLLPQNPLAPLHPSAPHMLHSPQPPQHPIHPFPNPPSIP